MKRLTKKIRRGGFDYELVSRGKKAFMYKQHLTNYEGKRRGTAYEVFKKRIAPERIVDNITIETHEMFPTDRVFGDWAWTYREYSDALKKFNFLEGIENESIHKFVKFTHHSDREQAKSI